MRRVLPALLLLLPTLILGGWAATLALTRDSRPFLDIALRGVDPRDLLRGHYLTARLDLPEIEGSDGGAADSGTAGAAACVCLDPDGADPLRPLPQPLPSCAAAALARCPYPLRDPGRTFRLYLPEDKAPEIERLLRAGETRITTRVFFHGDGRVDFGPPAIATP